MNTETGEVYRTQEELAAALRAAAERHAADPELAGLRKAADAIAIREGAAGLPLPDAVEIARLAGYPVAAVSARVAALMDEANAARRVRQERAEARRRRDERRQAGKRKRQATARSRRANRRG